MKLLLSALAALLCAPAVFATVHTVSNDPNKPAQFNNFTTAFEAAAAGDTLYIYGSPNTYGVVTVNKPITIIGPGYATRKEGFYKAQFATIFFGGGTVSNVTFDGITVTDFFLQGIPVFNFSNIIIRNCLFGQIVYPGGNVTCGSQLNNWLIENSVIAANFTLGNAGGCAGAPITPTVNGVLARNCIFSSGVNSTNNVNFVNCQFGYIANANFNNNRNCTFTNCMFIRSFFDQTPTNINNTFQHCITYETVQPSLNFDLNNWTNGASGTAINCIINQNPLWVVPPVNGLFNFNTLPGRPEVWNPALLSSSPARNAGTDGTDIGVSGGSQPYRPNAEPRIPVVRRYQIANPVVPSNGTINVRATATRPQ